MKKKTCAGNIFGAVFIYFAFIIIAGAIRDALGLESSDSQYVFVSLANVALCIVLPMFVRKNLNRSIRGSLRFREVKPLDVCMALCAVYAIPRLFMHFEGILLSGSMTIQKGAADEPSACFFFAAVIIGPIAEEIFFRHAIMDQLREALPSWIVMVIASLFFALLHGYDVQGFTCMLLFFFIGSLFYEKRGNLAFTIILHVAYNLIVYVLETKAFDAFWEAVSHEKNGFITYRPLGLLLLGIMMAASVLYFGIVTKKRSEKR